MCTQTILVCGFLPACVLISGKLKHFRVNHALTSLAQLKEQIGQYFFLDTACHEATQHTLIYDSQYLTLSQNNKYQMKIHGQIAEISVWCIYCISSKQAKCNFVS